MKNWVGAQGRGSRGYTEAQYWHIVEAFKALPGPLRADEFASLFHDVEPRAVRQILSDADGVQFVIAQSGDGLEPAKHQEDADGMTRDLAARGQSLLDRAARRRKYTATLPKRHPSIIDLFPETT